MDLKNGTITMQGLVSSCSSSSCTSTLPTSMDPYSGIVWWQDRRNSTVFYNEKNGISGCSSSAVCKGDDGSIIYCRAADCAANGMPSVTVGNCTGLITICGGHASNASVGLTIEPGNANLTLTGVFYQPRGAYLNITHGTATGNGFLQLITGSLNLTTGDDRVLLSGPTNPFITYKAILIQ